MTSAISITLGFWIACFITGSEFGEGMAVGSSIVALFLFLTTKTEEVK